MTIRLVLPLVQVIDFFTAEALVGAGVADAVAEGVGVGVGSGACSSLTLTVGVENSKFFADKYNHPFRSPTTVEAI